MEQERNTPTMALLDIDGTLVQKGEMPSLMRQALGETIKVGELPTLLTARVESTLLTGIPADLFDELVAAHQAVPANVHGGMLASLYDGAVVDVVKPDRTIQHVHTFPMKVPVQSVLTEVSADSNIMELVEGVVWRQPDNPTTKIVNIAGSTAFDKLRGVDGINIEDGDLDFALATMSIDDKISGELGKSGQHVEEGGQLGGVIMITKADDVKQFVDATSFGIATKRMHMLVSGFGKEHAMIHILPNSSHKRNAARWIGEQYGGLQATFSAGDNILAGFGLDMGGNDESILVDSSLERYIVVQNTGEFTHVMAELAGRNLPGGMIDIASSGDIGVDRRRFVAKLYERSGNELQQAEGIEGLAKIMLRRAAGKYLARFILARPNSN